VGFHNCASDDRREFIVWHCAGACVWCRVAASGSCAGLKNETQRIQLVSLCFGYVNVSGYEPLQRVAAGLSTHVSCWFNTLVVSQGASRPAQCVGTHQTPGAHLERPVLLIDCSAPCQGDRSIALLLGGDETARRAAWIRLLRLLRKLRATCARQSCTTVVLISDRPRGLHTKLKAGGGLWVVVVYCQVNGCATRKPTKRTGSLCARGRQILQARGQRQ
jgi:hypothetical protein